MAVASLTSHVGFWLRVVSNHVSGAFADRLRAHGATVPEWVVLRILWDRPMAHPSDVAREMGLTKGGLTKLVDRLVARRWVRRTDDPDDGRARTLSLTPSGRALVPILAAEADANDAACFAALRPAERRSLVRTLQRLVSHAGLPSVALE